VIQTKRTAKTKKSKGKTNREFQVLLSEEEHVCEQFMYGDVSNLGIAEAMAVVQLKAELKAVLQDSTVSGSAKRNCSTGSSTAN